jgi:hypothetical protein
MALHCLVLPSDYRWGCVSFNYSKMVLFSRVLSTFKCLYGDAQFINIVLGMRYRDMLRYVFVELRCARGLVDGHSSQSASTHSTTSMAQAMAHLCTFLLMIYGSALQHPHPLMLRSPGGGDGMSGHHHGRESPCVGRPCCCRYYNLGTRHYDED